MMQIRKRLKQSILVYNAYLFARSRIELLNWNLSGHPVPVPHIVKQQCVLEYQRRFGLDTLIETGTYQGDMIRAVHSKFKEIYSIELGPELHQRARLAFSRLPQVHLIQGDSAVEINNLMKQIDHPCLFWLDAHYSGGITARGLEDTPIMAEMSSILKHHIKEHVILIDDAHCFDGRDYPRIDQLKTYVHEQRPNYMLSIHQDIICIIPNVRSSTTSKANDDEVF